MNPAVVNKSAAHNLPCTLLKYLPRGVFSKYFIYVSIGWMLHACPSRIIYKISVAVKGFCSEQSDLNYV